ncbi:recombinase family protein [Nodularia harveyana UHCC-0300]|uniref:Recombinase family protein n=1 Tax=Nodularia harveyana UHCC-0300 TaxID=2974287 RepID=A0ABU5UJP3_9CYAN|nr:recombinase family protein [Nodularia harveyana]MEA5583745.1 recombinase family protein [Nodularia harveyana UHCC-0300]
MARAKANIKAVVIYTRVSTDEQGKSGLGLDAQLDACRKLANFEGLEIIGEYQDVCSGKSDPMVRDGFKTAIDTAIQFGAKLLISKLDRLSRDVFYVSSFTNGFMIKNCPKLIIAENPNASEFEINLRASLAQEERRLISERTKAALAVKKAQGCNLGQAGRQSHSDKAQEATEAAIIRAQELREQGLSLDKVCTILNTEGYTTSRGSQWSKQALNKRLKANPQPVTA